MQNRTDFFATGLVPVTNTTELPDACSICTDPFGDPVSLPCKHIFCKHCVVDWLSLPNRNTCPYCRHTCFTLTSIERAGSTQPLPRMVNPARTAILSQALALSGLMTGEFSVFNDDISWHTASIQRATASAYSWLAERTISHSAAIIDKRRVGVEIIAMGNLLRGFARASGRPYSAQQLGEWRIIIDILYLEISRRSSSTPVSGMDLSWQLNTHIGIHLEEALCSRLDVASSRTSRETGRTLTSTFLAQDRSQSHMSPAGDLDRLVAYVIFCASAENDRRQQLRRNIREEPRLINRVGVLLHNVFHHG